MYKIGLPEEYTDLELLNWVSLGTNIDHKDFYMSYNYNQNECFQDYTILFFCGVVEENCAELKLKLKRAFTQKNKLNNLNETSKTTQNHSPNNDNNPNNKSSGSKNPTDDKSIATAALHDNEDLGN